jgi:hypothetical protein
MTLNRRPSNYSQKRGLRYIEPRQIERAADLSRPRDVAPTRIHFRWPNFKPVEDQENSCSASVHAWDTAPLGAVSPNDYGVIAFASCWDA